MPPSSSRCQPQRTQQASTTVRPRLEAVGADLNRVAFVSIQTDDGLEDGLTIPDDMDVLHELVTQVGANLLVVDPLVAHLPGLCDRVCVLRQALQGEAMFRALDSSAERRTESCPGRNVCTAGRGRSVGRSRLGGEPARRCRQ